MSYQMAKKAQVQPVLYVLAHGLTLIALPNVVIDSLPTWLAPVNVYSLCLTSPKFYV